MADADDRREFVEEMEEREIVEKVTFTRDGFKRVILKLKDDEVDP